MDPITFEILRHRLWMINDQQGEIAIRISGSPLIYDAKDFSASLLTPDGDSLYIGAHVTRLSIALHVITKAVLRDCKSMGIDDGDMFFTNDPWAGTAHYNDQAVVAPVVLDGEIVCWTGIAMHDTDVGGPTFGGFSIRAADAFSEPPIVPPIKLVERGEMRPDLERLVLRNSRTPELNALNLRSRIAAQNVAHQRILEIVQEYGKDTLLEAQQQIIQMTRRAISRRLAELPDGTWRVERGIDHDGFENTLHTIRLTMTKAGDRLTFDFTGTDKQGRGTINCAPGGLEGGVYSAVLPMLCYDMPWCPAAIQQALTIVSEPGTLNNATYPAAIGTATVGAIWATGDAVRAALGKMMACSDKYRDEAQATWGPGLLGASVTGTSRRGSGTIRAPIRVGGSGATGTHDGLDGGGTPGAPTLTMENVESAETHSPIGLILYRKLQPETAGAGRYRGGAGVETLIVPFDVAESLTVAQYSQGHDHPLAKGLYGGYPGSIQESLILRNAQPKSGPSGRPDVPVSLEDVTYERIDPVPAKGVLPMGPNDAVVSWCSGGSGFGDPLERETALVTTDVERLALTPEIARRLYGVVVDEQGRVDEAATSTERQRQHAERLADAAQAGTAVLGGRTNGHAERVLSVGDAVDVVRDGDATICRCAACGFVYGPGDRDPKLGAWYRDRSLEEVSPLNGYTPSKDAYVLREFFCPSCGLLVDAQVTRPEAVVTSDTELALERAPVPVPA